MKNKKSLGQNWLKDRAILEQIVKDARVNSEDVVLEIGPGLGTLTSSLLKSSKKVVAVEFDENLAKNLPAQFPGKKLEVLHADFLEFDLEKLPKDYKVVANIPYYITNKILQKLILAENKPKTATLLVQKEVAERIVDEKKSLLSVFVEIFAESSLGILVEKEFFTPPPKVDSQIIHLEFREKPLISKDLMLYFEKVVHSGFAQKRKKLKSALPAGLNISKEKITQILEELEISPDARAENLQIKDWEKLAVKISELNR